MLGNLNWLEVHLSMYLYQYGVKIASIYSMYRVFRL